ncbi:MAG: hypothetical protein A2Y31_12525 [Spirochaetes bacterium GWC2_52_13]|nr:MAG: hypothetical protein A2Y31_12525 [Spirochaetes bacterium GWC2_52_13]HCG62484.1 hypothetical protein [Sphaerochaeta sp.]
MIVKRRDSIFPIFLGPLDDDQYQRYQNTEDSYLIKKNKVLTIAPPGWRFPAKGVQCPSEKQVGTSKDVWKIS